MNKFNKRLATLLIPMVMASSSAVFAEIPASTVVIGNKAYDLKYANDYKNIGEIKNAISESGNNIYIKLNNSKWFSNKSSKKVNKDIIPKVVYKDALGKEYDYEKSDGEKINLEITSASFVSSNKLIVNFNKEVSKKSLEKDNFNISGDTNIAIKEIVHKEKDNSIELILDKNLKEDILNLQVQLKKNISDFHGNKIENDITKELTVINKDNFQLKDKSDIRGNLNIIADNVSITNCQFNGDVVINGSDVVLNNCKGKKLYIYNENDYKANLTLSGKFEKTEVLGENIEIDFQSGNIGEIVGKNDFSIKLGKSAHIKEVKKEQNKIKFSGFKSNVNNIDGKKAEMKDEVIAEKKRYTEDNEDLEDKKDHNEKNTENKNDNDEGTENEGDDQNGNDEGAGDDGDQGDTGEGTGNEDNADEDYKVTLEDIKPIIDVNKDSVKVKIDNKYIENKKVSILILDQNSKVKYFDQKKGDQEGCSFETKLIGGIYKGYVYCEKVGQVSLEEFNIEDKDFQYPVYTNGKLGVNGEIILEFNENIFSIEESTDSVKAGITVTSLNNDHKEEILDIETIIIKDNILTIILKDKDCCEGYYVQIKENILKDFSGNTVPEFITEKIKEVDKIAFRLSQYKKSSNIEELINLIENEDVLNIDLHEFSKLTEEAKKYSVDIIFNKRDTILSLETLQQLINESVYEGKIFEYRNTTSINDLKNLLDEPENSIGLDLKEYEKLDSRYGTPYIAARIAFERKNEFTDKESIQRVIDECSKYAYNIQELKEKMDVFCSLMYDTWVISENNIDELETALNAVEESLSKLSEEDRKLYETEEYLNYKNQVIMFRDNINKNEELLKLYRNVKSVDELKKVIEENSLNIDLTEYIELGEDEKEKVLNDIYSQRGNFTSVSEIKRIIDEAVEKVKVKDDKFADFKNVENKEAMRKLLEEKGGEYGLNLEAFKGLDEYSKDYIANKMYEDRNNIDSEEYLQNQFHKHTASMYAMFIDERYWEVDLTVEEELTEMEALINTTEGLLSKLSEADKQAALQGTDYEMIKKEVEAKRKELDDKNVDEFADFKNVENKEAMRNLLEEKGGEYGLNLETFKGLDEHSKDYISNKMYEDRNNIDSAEYLQNQFHKHTASMYAMFIDGRYWEVDLTVEEELSEMEALVKTTEELLSKLSEADRQAALQGTDYEMIKKEVEAKRKELDDNKQEKPQVTVEQFKDKVLELDDEYNGADFDNEAEVNHLKELLKEINDMYEILKTSEQVNDIPAYIIQMYEFYKEDIENL